MSRLTSPPPDVSVSDRARRLGSLWRRSLARVAGLAAAYLVAVGILWLSSELATRWQLAWFPLVGLALDIGLLAAAGAWLNRRGHAVGAIIGPLLALLVIILLFAAADWLVNAERASFWSMRNLRTAAVQTSTIAVAALGMTVIIIAGGIDLSVGTTLSLAATVLAWALMKQWAPDQPSRLAWPPAAWPDWSTDYSPACCSVVPFIITLGTMTAYLGLGKMLASETTLRPRTADIPHWLPSLVTTLPKPLWLLKPLVPNFGWGVWLTFALAILLAALLHLTVFGRHVFALGSNRRAAQLCGINIGRTRVLVYALAGLFTGRCRHVSVHPPQRRQPHLGPGNGTAHHRGRGDRRRQPLGGPRLGRRHTDRRRDHAGHRQRLDRAGPA